jgi:hypothetical protein
MRCITACPTGGAPYDVGVFLDIDGHRLNSVGLP